MEYINKNLNKIINKNRNKSRNINKNGAIERRLRMFGLILPVLLLISACGTSPEADETMQTQFDSAQKGEAPKVNTEITDEEKEELIVEMLQSSEMDAAIVQSSKTTQGCTFELPEDFVEAEDMSGMYLNKHYPVDASTIYFAEKDKDSSLQLMTEQNFIKNVKEELQKVYGHEVEVKLESFEQTKIDGYPSFRILYSYAGDDMTITQLEYIINADKSYVIVYSQTDEYDKMEEFEASAATIKIKF